jgi:hypothetical protein
MREGDELSPYKKKLYREMNQYAEDAGMFQRFTPEEIHERFSEAGAKKLLSQGTFDEMYEDYITKPSNIGRVGSMRMGRDIGRKKKSSKVKPKRKIVKKKKGCGCK